MEAIALAAIALLLLSQRRGAEEASDPPPSSDPPRRPGRDTSLGGGGILGDVASWALWAAGGGGGAAGGGAGAATGAGGAGGAGGGFGFLAKAKTKLGALGAAAGVSGGAVVVTAWAIVAIALAVVAAMMAPEMERRGWLARLCDGRAGSWAWRAARRFWGDLIVRRLSVPGRWEYERIGLRWPDLDEPVTAGVRMVGYLDVVVRPGDGASLPNRWSEVVPDDQYAVYRWPTSRTGMTREEAQASELALTLAVAFGQGMRAAAIAARRLEAPASLDAMESLFPAPGLPGMFSAVPAEMAVAGTPLPQPSLAERRLAFLVGATEGLRLVVQHASTGFAGGNVIRAEHASRFASDIAQAGDSLGLQLVAMNVDGSWGIGADGDVMLWTGVSAGQRTGLALEEARP